MELARQAILALRETLGILDLLGLQAQLVLLVDLLGLMDPLDLQVLQDLLVVLVRLGQMDKVMVY